MNYIIDIKGMHCPSCSTLIKMSLEDAQFSDVTVNQTDNYATFSSEESIENVEKILATIFTELPDYTYLNLRKI